MPKSQEQIGKEAAIYARQKLNEKILKHGPGIDQTLKRLAELIDAKQIKATYDKDRITYKYSKRLADNPSSLKAIDMALRLLNAYPEEKLTLTHELTEHHRKLLDRIAGQSRDKLPSEEEDE